MTTLKSYPEYKDSRVPWLEQIPAHWEVKPTFAVFKERKEANKGLRESQVLSLSYGRIIKKQEDALHGLVPTSFETYQIVEPGNLILRLTDLQNDQRSLRVGLVHNRGVITSAYVCLSPCVDLLPIFAYYYLHAADVQKVFYSMGAGLRQSMGFDDLKRLPIAIPAKDEQQQIVDFLDANGKKVDRFIRAKRRLIALLHEQKQAVTHRAVTRGLDPDVPLKPSGVEWLGDVPEHWDVQRIKTLVKSIEQGVSPQAEALLADETSWGVLKAGCVNRGVFREDEHKRLPDGFVIDPRIVVRVGDILVSRASGSPKLVGSVGRVRSLNRQLILSDKTFRLNLRDPQLADFVVAAMNALYFRIQVEQAISGAEGLANNLPLSSLKDFRLAIPPAAEATDIMRRLEIETKEIDRLIDTASHEISLTLEYRTRLVADVVTGKLDVRSLDLSVAKALTDFTSLNGEITNDALAAGEDTDVLEEVIDADD